MIACRAKRGCKEGRDRDGKWNFASSRGEKVKFGLIASLFMRGGREEGRDLVI